MSYIHDTPANAAQPPAGGLGTPPATSALADRTARYTRKLDAALAVMRPAKRLPELVGERARWIAMYERFIESVDRGTYDGLSTSPTVHDYLDTIAVIDQHIRDLRRAG